MPIGCAIKASERPVIALDDFADVIKASMINIYNMYIKTKANYPLCNHFAIGVLMLVEKLIANHKQQDKSKTLSQQKNENLIRKITEYLDHHYTEPLTLKSISKAMHISETYLSHLYKRETGLSPIQYVIHCRIGEAQSLLMETNMPIHEIEEQLGFGSSCHLTTMFKKYVGISPREYRKHFFIEA